ncbi:hypothetical protein BC938DRAFT_471972 [Jimgerdemannia flammicorona]|uniref:Uncharacterized protein n=1 Tax=Jimgerdemannia flammicorona TaxID=994334 RepID=A0A433QUA8_9FUNG|nr:hypothetical protein BC938DRAFT_471972 [Jimgerdemannia flammicorona]
MTPSSQCRLCGNRPSHENFHTERVGHFRLHIRRAPYRQSHFRPICLEHWLLYHSHCQSGRYRPITTAGELGIRGCYTSSQSENHEGIEHWIIDVNGTTVVCGQSEDSTCSNSVKGIRSIDAHHSY